MHLAEGTLPLDQAAIWTAVAAPALLWSMRGEQRARGLTTSAPALMAGVTSLLFAATLLPLPVPVLGATSHICLTPVLALLVGLRRIIWPTFFVLLLQAIFFAHGGLTTLGVNTLTLGLFGPMLTVGLATLFSRGGNHSTFGLALACGLGGMAVYVVDALVLAIALADATAPMHTFTGVLLGFAPVQVPLSILEAVVSVRIIVLLARRRPDLLPANLKRIQRVPLSATTAVGLISLCGLSGCDYEGIDGTVFGAAAETSGRPPTDSILDLSQGELGLAMSIIILFGLGFLAGRSWEKLLGKDRPDTREGDAISR